MARAGLMLFLLNSLPSLLLSRRQLHCVSGSKRSASASPERGKKRRKVVLVKAQAGGFVFSRLFGAWQVQK